eukprot:maker-scaffold_19-snap-gene-5.58-mRNA-1 protein AED:0.01 eAED:0.01 QI:1/1/1/1/1/1/4/22/430
MSNQMVRTINRGFTRFGSKEKPEPNSLGPWSFKQFFGEKNNPKNIHEGDMLTALEFNQDGKYLATGDRAGRVVIFEASTSAICPTFQFHSEFQSHTQEFDALKSLEIEEKISEIKFLLSTNSSMYLLNTNDKTIKLWKNPLVPKKNTEVEDEGTKTMATYKNAHAYHINSIAPRCDHETFLSSDDLRIYLWNIHNSKETYSVLDIKPANMEDLTEVITSTDTHPTKPNIFIHSSSRGTGSLYDLRQSSRNITPAITFSQKKVTDMNNFFGEILGSISEIKFSGNYSQRLNDNIVIARDYLSVKVWDQRKGENVVDQIRFLDHLKPQLRDLYKNENIFDKFNLSIGNNGMATGSYNNEVYVFNEEFNFQKLKISEDMEVVSDAMIEEAIGNEDAVSAIKDEYKQKALYLAMHPNSKCLAVAIENILYIYGA